jgi:hypothetical protein
MCLREQRRLACAASLAVAVHTKRVAEEQALGQGLRVVANVVVNNTSTAVGLSPRPRADAPPNISSVTVPDSSPDYALLPREDLSRSSSDSRRPTAFQELRTTLESFRQPTPLDRDSSISARRTGKSQYVPFTSAALCAYNAFELERAPGCAVSYALSLPSDAWESQNIPLRPATRSRGTLALLSPRLVSS